MVKSACTNQTVCPTQKIMSALRRKKSLWMLVTNRVLQFFDPSLPSLRPIRHHSFHPHPHPHCPSTYGSCHLRCHSRLVPSSRLTRAMSLTLHPWEIRLLIGYPWNNYHQMGREGVHCLYSPPNCDVDRTPKRRRWLPMAHHPRTRYHIVFCSDLSGFARRECEEETWLRNPWALELVQRSEYCRIAILRSSFVAVTGYGSRDWREPVTK